MSGSNVTDVSNRGSTIPLSYPYSMPSQRAALQSALAAAGYSGAVVKLYDDEWDVFIPDLDTILDDREFKLTITPEDPYPLWDFFGNYLGLQPDNIVPGDFENLRATTGLASVEEANRDFARLKISAGTRYDPYH